MRIEDYGLIGDLRTAALVGRNGSIDWLCLPRFDSGACFAALLGEPRHGRWKIAPAGEPQTTRRAYRGDTLVLATEMECADGVVRLSLRSAVNGVTTHEQRPDSNRNSAGISPGLYRSGSLRL